MMKIDNELAKQSHPLNDNSDKAYNIVPGNSASEQVNITDAVQNGVRPKA